VYKVGAVWSARKDRSVVVSVYSLVAAAAASSLTARDPDRPRAAWKVAVLGALRWPAFIFGLRRESVRANCAGAG